MINIGDKVILSEKGLFMTEDGEAIPVGTGLYFTRGFIVRQHDPNTGAGNYGHPTKHFWAVTVEKKNGQLGIMLPEGYEVFRLQHGTKDGEQDPMPVFHAPFFISTNSLRSPSLAVVISLHDMDPGRRDYYD